MVLVSVAVFILSIVFVTYQRPKMLRNFLPGWLASGEKTDENAHPDRKEAHMAVDNDTAKGGDDEDSEESTPKAEAQKLTSEAPTFTLSPDDETEEYEPEPEPVAPPFPALTSAQRASAIPFPSKPAEKSDAGLMLPPPRPVPALKPSAAASLRVPTTGPLPNRGLPQNSQQRVSGGLSASAAVKTPNARGKVLLSPGHSPMDWAALTKKGNLGGVTGFQRVKPSQLKAMTGRKGKPAWSVWQGKVYNITPYLPFHPGGEAELMKAAGRDGTKLFMDVHPWVNWDNMLESCLVGVLVPEDFGSGRGSSLEDMD